jgi:hypothetical protein
VQHKSASLLGLNTERELPKLGALEAQPVGRGNDGALPTEQRVPRPLSGFVFLIVTVISFTGFSVEPYVFFLQ